MAKQLSDAELTAALDELSEWQRKGEQQIQANFEFQTTADAAKFVSDMTKELAQADYSITNEQVRIVLPKQGHPLTQTELDAATNLSMGALDFEV